MRIRTAALTDAASEESLLRTRGPLTVLDGGDSFSRNATAPAGTAPRFGEPAPENSITAGALSSARRRRSTRASNSLSRQVSAAYRDYQQKLEAGRGRTTRTAEVERVERMLDQTVTVNGRETTRRALVDEIARRANLPPALVAGIWYREDGSMRTDRYLHNGQQLGRRTTLVPRGIFFRRDQFVDAAVHALNQKRATADQLGLDYGSTDRAAMAAFAERYNGFGYRRRGVPSAYVTAGTDLYQRGMFVADGRYNPRAVDRRIGVLPIIDLYHPR